MFLFLCCHSLGALLWGNWSKALLTSLPRIYSYFLYVKSMKSSGCSLILYSCAVYCFHLSKFLSFSFISSPALPLSLPVLGINCIVSSVIVLNISQGLFLLFYPPYGISLLCIFPYPSLHLFRTLCINVLLLACSLLISFPSLFHNPDSSFSEPFGTFFFPSFFCMLVVAASPLIFLVSSLMLSGVLFSQF